MSKEKTGYSLFIRWLVIVGDLVLLNFVFFAVCYWYGMWKLNNNIFQFRIILLLLNVSYFFGLYFVPITIHKSIIFTEKVVQRSLLLISMHLIIFLTCIFFLGLKSELFPHNFIYVFYICLYSSLIVWRIVAREVLKQYRKRGRNFKRIIIIGAGENGLNLYAEMTKEIAYGYYILGFFDDNIELKNTLPNYLGTTHEVEDFALANNIDEIYCTLPNSQDDRIMRTLNFAEKNMIRFYIVPEFLRYLKKHLDLENIESVFVMAVRSEPLQSPVNRFIKRSFDILFSALFLCLIFPLIYIILSISIKLSSPGPIFFKQKRTGIYDKEFNCYKFRSMRPNDFADEKQAVKDDPRITRVGNFIRRTNLDELPQFINVLKGEMSVVGPRPHMLKHTKLYSNIIDKYMVRHLIKPGVTGWAQVNGYRGETPNIDQMEARVKYDIWYLENWSFLLDLKIIFVTVLNMFKGEKNAY